MQELLLGDFQEAANAPTGSASAGQIEEELDAATTPTNLEEWLAAFSDSDASWDEVEDEEMDTEPPGADQDTQGNSKGSDEVAPATSTTAPAQSMTKEVVSTCGGGSCCVRLTCSAVLA